MRMSYWCAYWCSSDLMRQKAGAVYREETNIPMIIAHPDVKGGRATKVLMVAIDIAPTLMALARLSADEGRNRFPNLPGVDVSALLSSPSAPTERDKRGHFFNYAVAHM